MDIDNKKLLYLLNNAEIYKVEKNIYPIHKNVLDLNNFETDLIFCSPPWGGVSYQFEDFSLLKHVTPNIFLLLNKFWGICKRFCLFLPKNTCLTELADVFGFFCEVK